MTLLQPITELFVEKQPTMDVFERVEDVRRRRWQDPLATWGLVPTMGFLHEGHLSLVRRAKAENDFVAVSIFVNPKQFNQASDLDTYPRNLARDLAMLVAEGVDMVWTPTPDLVYPPHFQTSVSVTNVAKPLEGASRSGHFDGVATVVAKLFNIFQPTYAYFGQKDAQQVVVLQRMVTDLNFNLEIVVCPTIREADGLAMSSRNARIAPELRPYATCLHEALQVGKTAVLQGIRDADEIRRRMEAVITATPHAHLDYVSAADPTTLLELETVTDGLLLSLAVFLGDVRLIDNFLVGGRF